MELITINKRKGEKDMKRTKLVKIFQVKRDHTKTLKEQKKQLEKDYINFKYLFSDGRKIHFIALMENIKPIK